MSPKPLTNAERQARWRDKRNALAAKATLAEARKPWKLDKARKGDAVGYADELREWWMAYEYRLRKELELNPATFADKDDKAEMARALKEVGAGLKDLAQKVGGRRVT